jgi:hypothetical protein
MRKIFFFLSLLVLIGYSIYVGQSLNNTAINNSISAPRDFPEMSESFSKMLLAYNNLESYEAKASFKEVTLTQRINNTVDEASISGIRNVTSIEDTLYKIDFNDSSSTKIEWKKCKRPANMIFEQSEEFSNRKVETSGDYLNLTKVVNNCADMPYNSEISGNAEKNNGTATFENDKVTISVSNDLGIETSILENSPHKSGSLRVKSLSALDSFIIPLIYKDFGTSIIEKNNKVSYEKTETVDGTDCVVLNVDNIESNKNFGIYFTLWIGKKDFLIRKVKMVNKVEGAEIITQEINEIEYIKWKNP